MRVIVAEPPMMAAIDAVFHIKGRPVLFAWGDRIYNPLDVSIRPELMAHEAVHGERQRSGAFGTVEEWWQRYIEDSAFRLAEEVPAHRAEYERLASQHDNAAWRRQALNRVAMRLRGEVYQFNPRPALHEARRFILPKV